MRASLVLNNKDEIALFYTERLQTVPEWASIDVDLGEMYLGGEDMDSQFVRLDKLDRTIYERVQKAKKILLVLVGKDKANTPQEAIWVPVMVTRQL